MAIDAVAVAAYMLLVRGGMASHANFVVAEQIELEGFMRWMARKA